MRFIYKKRKENGTAQKGAKEKMFEKITEKNVVEICIKGLRNNTKNIYISSCR